jgi:hypothetical protein
VEVVPSPGDSLNPKGIDSFSPGLDRFREGLPWVNAFELPNPVGVA